MKRLAERGAQDQLPAGHHRAGVALADQLRDIPAEHQPPFGIGPFFLEVQRAALDRLAGLPVHPVENHAQQRRHIGRQLFRENIGVQIDRFVKRHIQRRPLPHCGGAPAGDQLIQRHVEREGAHTGVGFPLILVGQDFPADGQEALLFSRFPIRYPLFAVDGAETDAALRLEVIGVVIGGGEAGGSQQSGGEAEEEFHNMISCRLVISRSPG